MPYVRFLKENMSAKGMLAAWFNLLPSAALAALKFSLLWFLFYLFSVMISFYLYNSDYRSLFVTVSMSFSVLALIFNYVLGYSGVKVMRDGVNGVKQDVLGAIVLTLRRIVKVFASSILLLLGMYFVALPSLYLPASAKSWYLFIVALLYIYFLPYIIFYPWFILLENKSVYDSFLQSYELVKGRWLKYAALFFISCFLTLAFVLGLIFCGGLIAVALNWDSSLELWRLNQALGITMPLNIKAAMLLTALSGYGIKVAASLLGFLFFSVYTLFFGLEIFILILAVSYKTLNDYKRVVSVDAKPSVVNIDKPAKDEILEITELFKNVKEFTIDTSEADAFDESALGRQNREEALRQFHKEDEDTSSVKPIIHEYPDPPEKE